MKDIIALLNEEEKRKLYSISGINHENKKKRSFDKQFK